MSKKLKKLILPLVLSMFLLAGCGANVVATVNGADITVEKLNEQVDMVVQQYSQYGIDLTSDDMKESLKMIKASILDELIKQELLLQEAEKQKIVVDAVDIEAELENIKSSFKDEKEYQASLASSGYTEAKLKELMKVQLTIEKLTEEVTKDVPDATTEEAKAYYEENIDQFTTEQQYEVRHILFSTQDKEGTQAEIEANALASAKEALASLVKGKDFAELATEVSEDTGTAGDGGYFTFTDSDSVDEDFRTAAKALQADEYTTEPVKSQFGYHIIKMIKVVPAQTSTFEQVEAEIMEQLNTDKKNQVFEEYVNDLKSKADIYNSLAEETEKTDDKDQTDDKAQTGDEAQNEADGQNNKEDTSVE